MQLTKTMELFIAVHKQQPEAVDALLAEGADPNASLTPDAYLDCLEYLGNERENPNREALAALRGDEMRAVFCRSFDPDNGIGYYPLAQALDRPGLVKKLLAAGANPDQRSALNGGTALHNLVDGSFDGAAVSAEYLLWAGADVDKLGAKGRTPLILGCQSKADGGLLEVLLEHGASVHARDNGGNTALHLAGFWDEGYLPWPLDKYREFGEPVPADCDAADPANGRFFPTRIWGAREAVNALVHACADPNAVNPQNGYTPMHWASVHHGQPYLCFLEALLDRGGRVDIVNHAGDCPLDAYFPKDNKRAARLARRFAEAARATVPGDGRK